MAGILNGHCSNDVGQAIMSNQFTVREISNRLMVQGWRETIRETSIEEDEDHENEG